jgi:hypothetical protein
VKPTEILPGVTTEFRGSSFVEMHRLSCRGRKFQPIKVRIHSRLVSEDELQLEIDHISFGNIHNHDINDLAQVIKLDIQKRYPDYKVIFSSWQANSLEYARDPVGYLHRRNMEDNANAR